jgi:hypothetical protein
MSCKKCGFVKCRCEKNETKPKTTNCRTCNHIHHVHYLIEGQCHDCWTVAQMPPDDREYYRVLAKEYNFKLVDIPIHVAAANRLNQTIEDYLASLPRSREEFKAYFKGRGINIGGVSL